MRYFQIALILLTALLMALPVTTARAMTGEIAVVVNSDAISFADVNDRMKLIMISSGLQNSPETREKLRPQILTVLIEEQIKLQEAKRLELEIEQAEIDQAFASLAKQNNFTADQFKDILKKSGINIETMYRQIRSQISWTKVIQKEVRPRINIRETDVNAALERIKNNTGKTEYQVAEIFLPIEKKGEERHVRELANKLARDIKSGQAPFFKIAQQFSQSAGAAKGGDIGWIQEGVLAEEIDKTLGRLKKEEVSDPIKTLAGYHIIFLRNKREITEDTIPSTHQITNDIGMARLEKAQRRHLMDLKATAFIDSRV